VVDAPALLVTHVAELNAIQDNWRSVQFHALREHAGLVFHAGGE
jgi:peptide chain release factor 3